MKKQSTYVLVGVFAVLAIIAYFYLRPVGERETSYTLTETNLSVDSALVRTIKVRRPSISFALQPINGRWHVVTTQPREWQYPADENLVRGLLRGAQSLRIVSPISSNPQKQGLFQVDSTGTLLSFVLENGKTAEFYVGKMGPTFQESFVRPAQSNEVYLMEGLMTWDVNREIRDWRDKTIFAFDKDSVWSIRFRYAKEQFTLKRDSVWRMEQDTAFVTEVNSILRYLADLRAVDFADTAVTLPRPQLTLTLDAATWIFAPVLPDSSRYWVKVSATPQVFIADAWGVKPLLKSRRDFVPKKK